MPVLFVFPIGRTRFFLPITDYRDLDYRFRTKDVTVLKCLKCLKRLSEHALRRSRPNWHASDDLLYPPMAPVAF